MSSVFVTTALDREQLILNHLPQVRLLATRLRKRCPHQVELDDLISAGTLGLIRAVDRFQSQRGYQLKTFAEHRIRGAMLDYLRQLDPLPRAVRSFVRRRDETSHAFETRFGRLPNADEMAMSLGIPLDKYRRLECTVRAAETVSLTALRSYSI